MLHLVLPGTEEVLEHWNLSQSRSSSYRAADAYFQEASSRLQRIHQRVAAKRPSSSFAYSIHDARVPA
jgi:hypothetical protein